MNQKEIPLQGRFGKPQSEFLEVGSIGWGVHKRGGLAFITKCAVAGWKVFQRAQNEIEARKKNHIHRNKKHTVVARKRGWMFRMTWRYIALGPPLRNDPR